MTHHRSADNAAHASTISHHKTNMWRALGKREREREREKKTIRTCSAELKRLPGSKLRLLCKVKRLLTGKFTELKANWTAALVVLDLFFTRLKEKSEAERLRHVHKALTDSDLNKMQRRRCLTLSVLTLPG